MRYKRIVDVIVSDIKISGRYDKVFFDHTDEIPDGYCDLCFKKNSGLYQIPEEMLNSNGKFDIKKIKNQKRKYQVKQADITGTFENKLKLIVEEEKTKNNIDYALNNISKCNFMVDNRDNIYFMDNPILFILVQNYNESTKYIESLGNIKRVIICDREKFEFEYNRAILI
jgi:hypothetical protein